MSTAIAKLDVLERREFSTMVAEIHSHLNDRLRVGQMLIAIRDRKLYRESHKTFEAFVRDEFGLKRQRAYELITASTVTKQLSENADTSTIAVPKESHAAELAKCPPAERPRVWQEAVASAPAGKVTAKHVSDVINRRVPINPSAAFCHQLADDEDDDEGFEPDALDDGEVIEGEVEPDEEPAAEVSYFARFKALWTECDETARSAIRAFVLNRDLEDDAA